jgi:hypothetical protein
MTARLVATLAALVALALALPLAASADFRDPRTAGDPCEGVDAPGLQSLDRTSKRACYVGFEIPPHRTVLDENAADPDRVGCPDEWRIRGSREVFGSAPPGEWFFWSYRGEWVTYSFSGEEEAATERGQPLPRRIGARAFFPRLHNWSSWSWPVRTYLDCESIFRLLAPPQLAQSEPEPRDEPEWTAQDDVLREGRGGDAIFGGRGDDELSGGRGDDQLLGGRGRDDLSGGPGDDELFDDQGRDVLRGGAGNDRFSARDGDHDVIDCGGGEDIAIGDRHDSYEGCEHVYRSAAEDPERPPAIG